MDKEEVYQMVKKRIAPYLARDIEAQISMATPNGMTAHKRNLIISHFRSLANLYENDWPEETMEQYRLRMPSIFNESLERISEAITYFDVKV